MPTERLKLADVIVDESIQPRVKGTDSEHVNDLKDAYTDGKSVPDPVVYLVNDGYILASGFHRYKAAKSVGILELNFEVRVGTLQDCQFYAMTANLNNSLKLTNADKRFCIRRAFEILGEKTPNDVIAKKTGFSDGLVKVVRTELYGDKPTKIELSDGRVFTVNKPKPADSRVEDRIASPDVVDVVEVEETRPDGSPILEMTRPPVPSNPPVVQQMPPPTPQLESSVTPDTRFMPNAVDATEIATNMEEWVSDLDKLVKEMKRVISRDHILDKRMDLYGTIIRDMNAAIDTFRANYPDHACPACCGTGDDEDGSRCRYCDGYGFVDEKQHNGLKDRWAKNADRLAKLRKG